jgi:serine/threonine protein kinase
VLCRFTAFCAVDRDSKVATTEHRVVQPVEPVMWVERGSFTGKTQKVAIPLSVARKSSGPYSGGRAGAASRATKTQAGVLKGKFAYMSPEQVTGRPLDPRHEVFVLGHMLWELLSGERLFKGDSDFALLEAVRHAKLPTATPAAIPPALDAVLRKALSLDADERFADGAELAQALEALAGELPPAPPLGDFVTASCPHQLTTRHADVACAMAVIPPDDGSVQLVTRIGIGGMAELWLGVREAPDGAPEPIIIRRVLPLLAEDDEWMREFLMAASFAASHPNLVSVLGVGDTFVAEELVRGVDLAVLQRVLRGPIPPRLAVEIIATVARVLAFCNGLKDERGALAGVIHRGLDPTQVMVGFDGTVKVLGAGAPPALPYALPPLQLRGVRGARVQPQQTPPPAPRRWTPPPAVPPRTFGDRLLDLFRPRRDFWK